MRLVLEYDGTEFHGFQRQPGLRTVQSTLEGALAAVCGHSVEVLAAGRTDAGVHASGQVVHFDTRGRIPKDRIAPALKPLLGHAVRVRNVEETSPEFHARYSAVRRTYHYYVAADEPSPFLTRYVMHEPSLRGGAVGRMREAMGALVGKHDFDPFGVSRSDTDPVVRTLQEAELDSVGALLRFRFTAAAFLRGMVRRMVGLVLEVGRGRQEPDVVRQVLDRAGHVAWIAAVAHGLFLVKVDYPDGYPLQSQGRLVGPEDLALLGTEAGEI